MKDGMDKAEALCREMLDRCLASIRERFDGLPASFGVAAEAARNRYDEGMEALLKSSDHALRYESARLKSRADFKARRAVLKTREASLIALLDEGRRACLQRWTQDPTPHAVDLAFEGIEALEELAGQERSAEGGEGAPTEGAYEIRLPEALRPVLEDKLIAMLDPLVRARFGHGLTLSLGFPEPPLSPGVVVASADGRLLYDNTLDDRFRRRSEALRETIGTWLDEGAAGD